MTTAPIPTAELERIIAVSEFDGLVVYEDYRRLACELIAAREALAELIDIAQCAEGYFDPEYAHAMLHAWRIAKARALLPSAGQETE